MIYLLRGFDGSGAVQTLRIDSDSSAAAMVLARARGLRVVSVQLAGNGFRARRPAWAAAKFDIGLFARELAALLDAGVGVIDALRTLGANERREGAARIYCDLLHQLEQGLSVSAALEQAGPLFPPVLVACVRASERTGGLAESLRRYSHNSAALQELRGRVVTAAIYPAVLLAVGTAVVLFLLGFVVPRFAGLLERSGHELPLLSRWLLAWGGLVQAQGTALAIGGAALLLAAILLLRLPSVRAWLADRMLALPGIGTQFRLFRQAQFFRTAAMLVEGGIPAIQAFELARGLISRADRAALARALQLVRNGEKISTAFLQCGLANPISHRLLTVAEKTGRLGPVLDRVAAFQESQVARAIELISRLIEPAMMIFIGVVIGGIVVLMYLPIFELASSLQ